MSNYQSNKLNGNSGCLDGFGTKHAKVDLRKTTNNSLIKVFQNLTPEQQAQLGIPCSSYLNTGCGYYGGGGMVSSGGTVGIVAGGSGMGWRSGWSASGNSVTPQ